MWFDSWLPRLSEHAVKTKRPGMLSEGIILLHVNDRPHSVNLVRDKLQRFGWETLQHPLVISIFLTSWRKIFVDVGFIRTRKYKSATYLFLQDWNYRLVSQWDKCINTSGNYFWIKQIPVPLCSGCSVFIWRKNSSRYLQGNPRYRIWTRAVSWFRRYVRRRSQRKLKNIFLAPIV